MQVEQEDQDMDSSLVSESVIENLRNTTVASELTKVHFHSQTLGPLDGNVFSRLKTQQLVEAVAHYICN